MVELLAYAGGLEEFGDWMNTSGEVLDKMDRIWKLSKAGQRQQARRAGEVLARKIPEMGRVAWDDFLTADSVRRDLMEFSADVSKNWPW
jgi:hypothetical protein